MSLDERTALAASDAYRWVPLGSEVFEVAGVEAIRYPEWVNWAQVQVRPLDTGLAPDQVPALIEQVQAEAAAHGADSTSWWISPSTRPRDLGQALVEAGGRVTETCDIYVLDLTEALPDPGDITHLRTAVVDDEQTLDDFSGVGQQVWGTSPPDEARRAAALAEIARPLSETGNARVVGYLDEQPVSMGGVEIVDGVARLWSAATLDAARGRGAYRAVLHHRLLLAQQLGARLALVHARVGTSGPIVQRYGFSSFGRGYTYELPISPSSPGTEGDRDPG